MRSPELLEAKRRELKKGENSEGGRIGYYRNPNYRLFKEHINPLAGGTVDLFLTGDFQRQLFVDAQDGKGVFDSNDEKAPELFAKYDFIRGIQEPTLRNVENLHLKPQLIKYIVRNV